MSLVRGTDRALKRAEVELPGEVVVDHVDSDAALRLHLQKREIVRQVFGARSRALSLSYSASLTNTELT
jgi:hypothetical protein